MPKHNPFATNILRNCRPLKPPPSAFLASMMSFTRPDRTELTSTMLYAICRLRSVVVVKFGCLGLGSGKPSSGPSVIRKAKSLRA